MHIFNKLLRPSQSKPIGGYSSPGLGARFLALFERKTLESSTGNFNKIKNFFSALKLGTSQAKDRSCEVTERMKKNDPGLAPLANIKDDR